MSTRTLQSDPETLGTFRKILLRSTAYAVSAYFLSFILEKILIVGGALIKGFSVDMKYNYTKITADFHSWDQDTVLLIYLIPFFLQALVFILLYIRFLNMEFESHYNKIFLLWLMFFIVYRLLGLYPGHIIFKTGIYYALNWLYLGQTLKIVTGAIAACLFIFSGFQIQRGILALSGTYHYHIRDMGIPNLIFSSLVIPIVTLSLITLLFYWPEIPNEEILGLVLIMVLNIYIYFKMFIMDPNLFSFMV